MRDSNEYYKDVFIRLGIALEGFGTTAATRLHVAEAVAANGWFTVNDVIYAADAIRHNMLSPHILGQWPGGCVKAGISPKRVAVIMAGNIPLVGFHDLMCVVASGNIPYIKPSSKDTVLIECVAGLIKTLAPGIKINRFEEGQRYDAVLATGSDNTGRYFRSMFEGVPSVIRGSRSSAAILRGDETPYELELLSGDIFRYSGLGCRNVSMVFVPSDYDTAGFCKAVAPARQSVNSKYYNNYLSLKGKLAAAGEPFIDAGIFVVTEGNTFPASLSNVVISRYDDIQEAYRWLSDNDSKVQCVVGRGLEHPRAAGFGNAQSPFPWDYPDGVDIMEFLSSL